MGGLTNTWVGHVFYEMMMMAARNWCRSFIASH